MKKRKVSQTCIAAIKGRGGKIYIAADRQVTWDDALKQTLIKPKVMKRKGIILAATGDSYLCGLLVERLSIPRLIDDLDTYMYEILHDRIKALLIRKEYINEHRQLSVGKDMFVELVVGVRGRAFTFRITENSIIEVDEVNLPYCTGCGGFFAWGSLLTTEKLKIGNTKERLMLALSVAAELSPGCDANIDIEVE